MRVSDYLREIGHAAKTVISEIHREHDQLAELESELKDLTATTRDGYSRVEFLAMNPEFDDEGLGTAIQSETYFGVDKKRFYKEREVKDISETLAVHQFSIAALAGSLLQYAKQGLALRFAKCAGIPSGRKIHGIEIHEVIWCGRNQAIHWEEGTFHNATEACFRALAVTDPIFTDYATRSMAYEILTMLGWKTFDDFSRDMMLFDV